MHVGYFKLQLKEGGFVKLLVMIFEFIDYNVHVEKVLMLVLFSVIL